MNGSTSVYSEINRATLETLNQTFFLGGVWGRVASEKVNGILSVDSDNTWQTNVSVCVSTQLFHRTLPLRGKWSDAAESGLQAALAPRWWVTLYIGHNVSQRGQYVDIIHLRVCVCFCGTVSHLLFTSSSTRVQYPPSPPTPLNVWWGRWK